MILSTGTLSDLCIPGISQYLQLFSTASSVITSVFTWNLYIVITSVQLFSISSTGSWSCLINLSTPGTLFSAALNQSNSDFLIGRLIVLPFSQKNTTSRLCKSYFGYAFIIVTGHKTHMCRTTPAPR